MSTVTDEIKARVDLVDLVGRSVQLRKSGSAFKGLCPFHGEKTPSFYVFPQSHTWVCFGCGKKGTAFDWLMEREHLEFGEALRSLAQLTGVELPSRREPEQEEATRRLYDLLDAAARYYHGLLLGAAGAGARRYLAGRGVSEEITETFALGYAPPTPGLQRHLAQAGYSDEEMVQAAVLSIADDGRHFEFFRDRVLFPIRDSQGRTVAFGGRTLGDGQPKYLNSRDTLLFHKQETLFALDLARKPIASERRAVIVEGYMDALMAHQHGYRNVVATLGTAVTERHLGTLRRLVDEIVLALDSDAAGQAATWRALQVAEQSLQAGLTPVVGPNRRARQFVPSRPVQLKVLTVPGAKDPDEFIRADPAAWPSLVQAARPFVDFVLEGLGSRYDLTSATGKAAAAAEAAELLAGIANPIEQAHYAQRVAALLNVDEAAVRQSLRQQRRQVGPKPAGPASQIAAGEPERSDLDPLDAYALALLRQANGSAQLAPAEFEFAQPQSRALASHLQADPEAVPTDLRPYLPAVERYAADVLRLAPDALSRELARTRARMQRQSLLLRWGQVRALLREADSAEEQVQWKDELSRLAHRLNELEEILREAPLAGGSVGG